MAGLDAIREALPEAARDIRLNLGSVLQGGALSPAQRWGVAIADARAAAALMAMNNVYYRFRHFIGKSGYAEKPARLRMNRLARPATNKADFELFALAVSVMNGCESCLRAHEAAVLHGGLTEEHVHDAVRIAATMQAAAVGLEMGETGAGVDTGAAA
jgi:alkyl hydroperoxide reductase subunit D